MTLAYHMNDPLGAHPASSLADAIAHHGAVASFNRNEELFAQEDEVERLFLVESGVVRTTRLGADGRRQVGGFYYPGDVVGLEPGPQHRFAAEALTDVEVRVARHAQVRAFVGDAELNRAILEATRIELERAQNHMLLLGLKNAREKVAAFLLTMSRASAGQVFELAMGRQDMADYLGLTIETVSRTLGQLQDEALVEFPSARQFRVPQRDALEALAA
jgi:CRP/FNR family nitrogen fixation transcriptional regulator